jgi:hypothetical protein
MTPDRDALPGDKRAIVPDASEVTNDQSGAFGISRREEDLN